ncbi:rod shape-determining protein RodA [Clostridium sp. MD294]|uniref:rod shape-determining protein RodA n=1 Tax=Clostridium sp. MD294 TaxID=97138 RepID=UPI0002C92D5A|nr:rod shape-determining protein RodA [Clostridium sp. MD294]NDO47309.1 rod shape-determining protein RodA [Clostridium sp. MD294]USF29622.1 putative peptidoglycan glycosyltransferase FtsW [Clostridium sp. MD294]
MNVKKQLSNLDFWLIGAICILSIFGIICIGSATHINLGADPDNFYKQMIWFVIGLALMIIASLVDYEALSQFYILFYLLNILLLVAVLFLGSNVNGATRWIAIGPINVQPSEFAKLIMIFFLAKLLTKKQEQINQLPTLLLVCISVVIPVALIQEQPSLSASLVLLAILCITLFVAGIDFKIIRLVLYIVVPAIAFVLWDVSLEKPFIMDKILKPHQFTRILTFVDPSRDMDSYYQTEKAINAIGSGQLNGKGLYQGTLNQLSYLPEPHNDFIFSVIGEEFGFIGCAIVLLLLLFIIFRCILIAVSIRDLFSQLIVVGVAGMIAFQTFINVGVATGIMPNTGMSLPFVSYGGSSMWTNMTAIGLVLNIGMKRSKSLFEGV